MKRIYFLFVMLVALACQKEEDAGAANEKTFIRYFGTVDNNIAVLAIETQDGFALLSNTEVEGATTDANQKIKLIKTDLNGHQTWEQDYPETTGNWAASSFITLSSGDLNSGYLIIGESINANTTDLLLVTTDAQGNMVSSAVIPGPSNTSLRGRAVTLDAQGDYTVLASMSGDAVNDLYVAKINADDLTVIWSRVYGAGASSTTSRIFYNSNQNLVWSGSVQDAFSQKYDVRMIQVQEDSQTPNIGGPLVDAESDEYATDFCKALGGWAITGSSNANGTDDVYVLKLSNSSNLMFSIRLEGEPSQNERGVSIDQTPDNNLVVLATVGTASKKEDLSIIKLSNSGSKIWQHNYGGADRQEGASIRATSDGSYLIFGTTYFINEAKLMLMKVNRNGEL